MARLGLSDMANRKVRELSGGNRRRVELARALMHQPRVLLMDEPTVGLDPASRRDLLRHVMELRTQGVGVLWATHLVDEAEGADRIVILHHGKVLREGVAAGLTTETGAGNLAAAFMALTEAKGVPGMKLGLIVVALLMLAMPAFAGTNRIFVSNEKGNGLTVLNATDYSERGLC